MKNIRDQLRNTLPFPRKAIFACTLTLTLALFAMAPNALAASLSFSPGTINVTAAPGETVSVPFEVVFSGTTRDNAFANFRILQTVGNLNRAWVSGAGNVALSAANPVSKELLTLSVPAEASEGFYNSKFRSVWLRSNEYVSPIELTVGLTVQAQASCQQPPTISGIQVQKPTVKAKNNKPFTVLFTGSIESAEGCQLSGAWYSLSDEYGELDETGDVTVQSDGSFSVEVTMLASRDGKDKDGRTYTVVFGAENEAGTTEGGETAIVVSHDNRKK